MHAYILAPAFAHAGYLSDSERMSDESSERRLCALAIKWQ